MGSYRMEIWQYFLMVVGSSAGLFCGRLLGRLAKGELAQGKRYFRYLKEGCIAAFLALLFAVLFTYNKPLAFLYLLTLACVAIALSMLQKKVMLEEVEHDYVNYALFSLLLFAAVGNQAIFFVTALLVFLYGLPAGSLLYKEKAPTREYLIPTALLCSISAVLFLMFF